MAFFLMPPEVFFASFDFELSFFALGVLLHEKASLSPEILLFPQTWQSMLFPLTNSSSCFSFLFPVS